MDQSLQAADFDEKVRKITGAPARTDPPAAAKGTAAVKASRGASDRSTELAWFARKAGVKLAAPAAGAKPPSKAVGIALIAALAAIVLLLAGGLAFVLLRGAGAPAPARDSGPRPNAADLPAAVADLPTTSADGLTPAEQPGAPSTPAAPSPSPEEVAASPILGDTPYLEGQKAAAQSALAQQMSEPRGLLYRDVQTVVATADGAQSVNFCGSVNSRNPKGDYIGYQRFISSADHAQVEQFMTPGEFAQAWRDRCSGDQGPQIWR
ncbi:MAG: hypothetical protein JO303_11645 [Caulobacteraceae bacterium]|nr:hypothetical protein [Caulobacteraceae bacterium]